MARRFAWCSLWMALAACSSGDDGAKPADAPDEGCGLSCGAGRFCEEQTNRCFPHLPDGAGCTYDSACQPGSRCVDMQCVNLSAPSGGTGGGAGEGGSGPSASPIPLELPFTPSNVGELVQDRMLSADSDIVIRGGECRPCACGELMAVATAGAGCYDDRNSLIRQLDIEVETLDPTGSADPLQAPIVVFVRNLIADVDADFAINFPGHPTIIVAQEKIELTGDSLWLAESGYRGGIPDTLDGAPGDGPGGGGFERGTYPSGEGGAYCTFGSVGDDMEPPLGVTYGNEALVPLMVGSGGGSPWVVSSSLGGGWGGGAMQFVAGESIVIGPEREISVQGGSGASDDPNGPGGGSGGSLLLEAPSITVEGSLLATGGEGGGYDHDGGKGGDGRIRINTMPSGFTMGASAVIDPPLGSECATAGTLAP